MGNVVVTQVGQISDGRQLPFSISSNPDCGVSVLNLVLGHPDFSGHCSDIMTIAV